MGLKKFRDLPRRKKVFWLTAAALVVLILAIMGIGSLVPYYYAKRTMPDYIDKNQRYFRAENIIPGTFNRLMLTNVSLGESAQPLVTAPVARLYLSYSAGMPAISRLELDEVKLAMTVKGREIWLNGIAFNDFLTQITSLPKAPNGATIPLGINTLFTLGNAPAVSLHISIRPGSGSDEFLFSGKWDECKDEGAESGSWSAVYDRGKNTLAVSIEGGLAPHFLQEILLRSREPELMAGLIQSGRISGKGSLAAELPQLAISDFTFSGTLANGAFGFHKLALRSEKPFSFELQKGGQGCTLEAPAIELAAPFPIPLANVFFERKAKQPEITFRTDADMRGALGRVLEEQCNMKTSSKTPMIRHIDGSINARTLVWDVTGSVPDSEKSAKDILFESEDKRSLAITLDNFELRGHGKGAVGTIESELGLQALTLTLPEGTFKADRLDVRTTRELGSKQQTRDDRIEFHSNKLTGDTPKGQCEIENFSGEIGIHRTAPDKAELQWIARGGSFLIFSPLFEMRSQDWKLVSAALRDKAAGNWTLTTLDAESAKADLRALGEQSVAKQLKLHLSGSLENGKVPAAEARIRAAEFLGKRLKAKQPQLSLTTQNNLEHWSAELAADVFEIPFQEERPWVAKKCSVRAEGSNLTIPESIFVKAETLAAGFGGWLGDFRSGEWTVSHKGDAFAIASSAEAARVSSPRREMGNGDFGAFTLAAMLRVAPDGKVLEWNADWESKRPSWSFDEIHSSGELGKFALRYRADDANPYSGAIELEKATFLGTYYSVMAPELAYRAEYSPVAGTHGSVKFRDASITSPDGRLELTGSSLDLPWSISAGNAASKTQTAGILTAREVRYDGENQGPLELNLAQCDTRLDYQGLMKVKRFGGAPLELTGAIHLPPEKPLFKGQFSMAAAELAEPWEPGKFFPNLPGTMLKGRLAASAAVEFDKDKNSSAAIVTLENSDWQFGNTLIEGLSANAELTDLGSMTTKTTFPVTAKRFVWNGYELADNSAMLAFLPGSRISLSSWAAKYGNGTAELNAPAEFSYAGNENAETPQSVALGFNAENVPLADLLHKLGLAAVESDAAVSGKIQTSYQNGALHFAESRVGFRNAAGEILKMNDVEGAMIRMKDPVYQSFVQTVMREVRCTSGEFEFHELGSELIMKIKAEGRPVQPVPFVYQGRSAKSQFRPAEPGEAGFDGEIQFSVNLKIGAPAYRKR